MICLMIFIIHTYGFDENLIHYQPDCMMSSIPWFSFSEATSWLQNLILFQRPLYDKIFNCCIGKNIQ
jgi:hypothetical protein